MNPLIMIAIGVVSLVLILWLGNKVLKIFKGDDGKFSKDEFLRMSGAGTLLGLTVFMIYKEATRTEEWQLFGSVYIFLVIGGFLTAVNLDKVMDTTLKILNKRKNEER